MSISQAARAERPSRLPIEVNVPIPSGVEARLEGERLEIKGPLGTVSRDFSKIPVRLSLDGNSLRISSMRGGRRQKALVYTVQSHIENMITGVTKGFTYRLKIVYAHFPPTVKVSDGKVIIENFLGERSPRKAEIVGACKVLVEDEDVVVKGIDKEAVGQTAANIERATKIKKKDPRVFLDGIYIYKREVGI
jgi:large subunit ribosomal protein L6